MKLWRDNASPAREIRYADWVFLEDTGAPEGCTWAVFYQPPAREGYNWSIDLLASPEECERFVRSGEADRKLQLFMEAARRRMGYPA